MFKKLDVDKYELNYINKQGKEVNIEFTRKNLYRKELESINFIANDRLIDKIAEKRKSKKDYVIVKKDEKGHITEDETNWNMKLQNEINEVSFEIINKISKDCFGKDVVELDLDGVNTDKFMTEFTAIITGADKKSPSKE